MLGTIVGALLPIVVTLLLGFAAGWHHDFDGKQAPVLNRMVMLYALPLSLFAGMIGISRDEVLSEGPLALAILAGMAGSYAVVLLIARYLQRRDIRTSSLQALAITGPAVPFVGVSVLGHLFGTDSVVPISVASIVMNLIQVPATLMLLAAGTAQEIRKGGSGKPEDAPSLADHVVHAVREPVVWAPLVGLAFVLTNLRLPAAIHDSFMLLGSATGGVALFASGIVLFSRKVSLDGHVVLSVVARNVVIPGLMLALLPLTGMSPETTREAVLTLAIPTASIAVILAVQYQTAEQEMASTLFFSTIFSIVSMGAFIWLTA